MTPAYCFFIIYSEKTADCSNGVAEWSAWCTDYKERLKFANNAYWNIIRNLSISYEC